MVKSRQPARLNRYANLTGSKKRKPNHRHKRRVSLLKRISRWSWKKRLIVLATPLMAVLILVPLITYLILANDIKNPERLMNRNNTGIVLLDVTGKTFYSVGRAEHRNQVALADISPYLKDALIASEDKDFYKHGGFNPFSTVRAVLTGYGGGSTLTQQLVKNTLLSSDHSYLRKYQEIFMAMAVENNYSKDEILDMYLNSVFFGENAFGIEDASDLYFGKKPKDLNLAESAMLIGLLPAPNAYSPISGNKQYAKERQTTVLTRMVSNGYVTENQKQQALNVELTYATEAGSINSIAPHFAEMVINELSKQYGYEKVMRSGYQISTTLDLGDQQILSDNVALGIKHINNQGGTNASGIVIDPTSGEVRALVGSADYNNPDWGKVNMVTTPRQPGSSFKPIYYSGALANGTITPATILDDKVMDFGGGYVPRDADRNESSRGQVSVREALDWSLNIPSIHVMQAYGIGSAINTAKDLGITTIDVNKNYGLSLALGSAEVSLMQMTHAYTAFANSGQQYNLITIKQIKDKFGKNIFSNKATSKYSISKDGAYLISNILSDNATRSRIFGSSLNVSGHTVAVKTGTTNDNKDAWTIGYNPNIVVGVWVGNNDNTSMRSGGSDMAGPIWRGTMNKLLSGKPNINFVMPDTIVTKQVCRGVGALANKSGPNTYNEVFMAGALPTKSCEAEPVMISVCDLESGSVTSIDETSYSDTKYSKNVDNCEPPTQKVCNTSSGKLETIYVIDFDASKYSKNLNDCGNSAEEVSTVRVCDTKKGRYVRIAQLDIDNDRYVLNTATCQKAD